MLAGICAYAQKGPGIAGVLMDQAGNPVPFANVALHSIEDSSLLAGTASREDGRFFLDANSGTYYVQVSFLSFDTKVIPNVEVQSSVARLGKIELQQSASSLDEMVVTAERSNMELRMDKRVFNVSKEISNQGRSASEILENLPSVDVDVDGNVSLRGSQGVRILIDGKPSGLVGASSSDALRLIPGNLIERVEVITNPSARYDAEGEVGIINIVLKKEKREGVNGSFELNTGIPHNHGASMNMNWRKRKFNLFANYGLSYRSAPGGGFTEQEFISADTSYSFSSQRDHQRADLSNLVSLGSDIYLNDQNILTVSGLYKISSGDNLSEIRYKDEDGSGEVIEETLRDDKEREDEQDIEGTISYRKKFRNHKDHQWVTEVKWTINEDLEASNLVQTSSLPNSRATLQRSESTENENNYLFQSDYVHPFSEKGSFEAGVKATLREIQNTFSVEINDDGTWDELTAFNNDLRYSEGIYAGYLIFSNELQRFSYQLGLRGEYSDIETELRVTGEKNPRKYFNLFPSGHLSYKWTEKRSLQLSYSRRLSRPSFFRLAPFLSFTDPRNFYSGNPDLNPEFTHSIEAGMLNNWESGSLLSSIYYRHTTGVIERITITDSTTLTQSFPVNLGQRNAAGAEFSLNINPTKKWRISTNANVYYEQVEGEYEGQVFSSEALTLTSRLMNSFDLPKDVKLQFTGSYRAPRNTTQGRSLSIYALDVAIAKEVLKGNGTLSLSVRDVFNTRKRRREVQTEFLDTYSEFQWRRRQLTLSFNYRLNQRKSRQQRDSRGNSDFDM